MRVVLTQKIETSFYAKCRKREVSYWLKHSSVFHQSENGDHKSKSPKACVARNKPGKNKLRLRGGKRKSTKIKALSRYLTTTRLPPPWRRISIDMKLQKAFWDSLECTTHRTGHAALMGNNVSVNVKMASWCVGVGNVWGNGWEVASLNCCVEKRWPTQASDCHTWAVGFGEKAEESVNSSLGVGPVKGRGRTTAHWWRLRDGGVRCANSPPTKRDFDYSFVLCGKAGYPAWMISWICLGRYCLPWCCRVYTFKTNWASFWPF